MTTHAKVSWSSPLLKLAMVPKVAWVDAGSLYGNDAPPLLARTVETAARVAMTAVEAARTKDRNFMNCWGMPGSFHGSRERAPGDTVCCAHALVNYC
jgi:hypothetical protein